LEGKILADLAEVGRDLPSGDPAKDLRQMPRDFVFMTERGEQGNTPVANFTKPKQRLDARASQAGVQPFTYHDCRRTVATSEASIVTKQDCHRGLVLFS
jgi:hypothetical protein